MGRERAQLGEVGVVEARGRVRVAADRGIHLGKRNGRGQRRATGGAVDAHGQHAPDAGALGGRDELRLARLAQVQMGMRVDHEAGSAAALGKSDSIGLTRSMAPAPSSAPDRDREAAPSASSRRSALAGR